MEYLYKNPLHNEKKILPIFRDKCSNCLNRLDYHPHYELYYCKNFQKQEITVGGEKITISVPVVIITPPYTTHYIHSDNTNFERFVVYYNDECVERFIPDILPSSLAKTKQGIIFYLNTETTKKLYETFKLLYEIDLSENEKQLIFVTFLSLLNRIVPEENRKIFNSSDKTVMSILEYVNLNYNRNLNAEKVAEKFHISRAKLNRDFNRYVGKTFHNIVLDKRLSVAIRFLKSSNEPISKIATLAGFENEYYFYSFFKKSLNQTPLEYRKMSQLENQP